MQEIFPKKTMEELNRLSTREFAIAKKTPVVLVLDNIRSMHNVGAIFRTADAFVLEKIFLCGFTPAPPHREINKTALGATETVAWEHCHSATDCLLALLQQDYTLLAIEQTHDSIMLQNFEVDINKKYALILGNEVEGVQQDVLQLCKSVIEIPQAGSKHSLNVSVSAGILAWHFYRALL